MNNSINKRFIVGIICLVAVFLFTGSFDEHGCDYCNTDDIGSITVINQSETQQTLKVVIYAGYKEYKKTYTFGLGFGNSQKTWVEARYWNVVAMPLFGNNEVFRKQANVFNSKDNLVIIIK